MVSSVNFVRELRNAMANWAKVSGPNGHTGPAGAGITNGNGNRSRSYHDDDENTPLILRPGSSPAIPAWRRFLWDCHRTPGDDSSNIVVKALANTWHVTKISLLSSPVNILMVFVPVGIIAGVMHWSPAWVFTLNFLAIIPLAAILSFATEEISVKLGETLGGLINATFGNAVELIVSVIALKQGQIEVVQASMLGSILSNLLLVMGMCFLLGGWFNMYEEGTDVGMEQAFASGTAQTTCSLLTLAAAAMIIPATLYGVLSERKDGHGSDKERDDSILLLSRGTSIILLILYCMYLWFQLRTHKNLFSVDTHESSENGDIEAIDATEPNAIKDEDEDEEEHMTWWAAGIVLVAVTVVISFSADYLVESIEPIVETGVLSRSFIGLILIPIVGNAAEHVTACVVAVRNKMDLAMGVAIGSSIQIALLVTPALVITAWVALDDTPMSLRFDTFQTVAFALSVLVVTYTVQDGKSNYLEGAMLLGLYIIIALAFYATPI
ncbi:vacuolar calcium ion transporter [Pyricularia oryzae 70-15]|uniref:Vacuolar calcium ion transporter n=1 Tax=Pyricularia oryzae (strain 70-15 / ATCC MYA-4617 / FGSC 8958) TaxID=242507 RepID=G4NCW8_PYRO7|nr:vacuolar calcium ion transporter [Pyricularia oryzae 70-15]EHA48361.1 vacuolar calcium ion transporter [Pyricularia oryzae 70-15]